MQGWKSLFGDLTFASLPLDLPYEEGFAALPRQCWIPISESISKQLEGQSFPTIEILGTVLSVLISRLSAISDIVVGVSTEPNKHIIVRLPLIDVTKDTFNELLKAFSRFFKKSSENWEPLKNIIDLASANSQLPYLNRSIFCACIYGYAIDQDAEEALDVCDLSLLMKRADPESERIGGLLVQYNACIYSTERIEILCKQFTNLLQFFTSPEGGSVPVGKPSILTDLCRDIVPNPADDLNFNEFEGSIIDIFSSNAKKHPERLFVCETESGINYSYKDIEQATNILANYLSISGLVRGDVVGIYSYRGVGLVVAILGVLKAGLIYFTIDPAYPPARQIVYIQSAKPKALIFLSLSGEPPSEVTEYICSDALLQIRNLELLSTTKRLEGQSKVGNKVDRINFDIIDNSSRPNVLIGPDTIATLSFTSGSTGIPKGVLGRHFSLTHFYPFMSMKYNLNAEDRFTMLSGISHDPIQRDIFTPLYLGASLYVPSTDDIAITGKLAQWFLENKITVTHLTPAMGMLLTSKVEGISISTLKNAFFVGDFLFKGDVEKLRNMCPNVDVINMYGSTETQRAVSYYYIPSRSKTASRMYEDKFSSIKSIVPLGIGMKDVQLIVVNKFNEQCGVGEPGEVYVRSSGIAEGYLDKQESSLKFIDNWLAKTEGVHHESKTIHNSLKYEDNYYKGPRDRMYRTGDLGFYRCDKNVESMGRIDDQIKIRGFRIELKEIYICMANCPLVSGAVVILRNDENNDKYLVCYFKLASDTHLTPPTEILSAIGTIRNHLKSRLPSYAVPKFIIPIKNIPLTPNGKVDKRNLPDPLSVMLELEKFIKSENKSQNPKDSQGRNSLENDLIDIVTSILGLPSSQVSLEDNFFDLGGHSILATKMHYMLLNKTELNIKLSHIYSSKTLGDMLNIIKCESTNSLITKAASFPHYSEDLITLSEHLTNIINTNINDKSYVRKNLSTEISTIFLTGVTGFLGSFILGSILKKFPLVSVVNLVRAENTEKGLQRIISSLKKNLLYDEKWFDPLSPRVSVVCGDLSEEHLGLTKAQWNDCCDKVDIIVHNGALVHWLYPYEKLRKPNTLSTIAVIEMACKSKIKPLIFVSSTSVFDTPEYVARSLTEPINEDDLLELSNTNLDSGYAQSKWVSEKLVLLARSRGLPFIIVRPGYIFGDSNIGVVNTDDFLWRFVAGCVELKSYPKLLCHINVYPVDYVADLITHIIGDEDSTHLGVFNVWNNEDFTMKTLFEILCNYYDLQEMVYSTWKEKFESTVSLNENCKLYPLIRLVFGNLPITMLSPRLDYSNTLKISRKYHLNPVKMLDLVHLYIGYLCKFKFLPSQPHISLNNNELSIPGKASVKRLKTTLPYLKQWDHMHDTDVFDRNNT